MSKKLIKVISIVSLISLVALPNNIKAKSIKDFENEVAKYTSELQAKKDKIAKNDAEVAQIKKKISEIQNQIKNTKEEISSLEAQIKKNNEEIAKKKEESKKIMKYFQVMNGENSYLEYIFGSTSITDMIYRISVVEQLTDYNQKMVKELTELIETNKRQKSELEQKRKELEGLEKSLVDQKERIGADTASIKAGMPGVEQQIKSAKEQVAYFKKLGCGADEDVAACSYRKLQSSGGSGGASLPSVNGFYRPIEYGYIVRGYTGCGTYLGFAGCTGHTGIDIGSSNKSINVYPIASGTVSATYHDPAGALVVKIRHNYNGRFIYSTYAHQRNFAVSTNQYVSHTTSIGQMGSTGNSTGPHLHLEVSTCDWKSNGGGCTWESYAKYNTKNPANYVSFPSRWSNR